MPSLPPRAGPYDVEAARLVGAARKPGADRWQFTITPERQRIELDGP
jgi:hypothetical protein